MRIILIGPRGAGKSAVAGILSEMLKIPCYSTDRMVEEKTGYPITEIVEREGWGSFRKFEAEVCRSLAAIASGVIDCGGGSVCDEENANNLCGRPESVTVLLTVSPKVARKRMSLGENRPALSDTDAVSEWEAVYQSRLACYQKLAQVTIDTSKLLPDKIAARIVQALR